MFFGEVSAKAMRGRIALQSTSCETPKKQRDRAGDSFVFEELPPQEVRGIDGRVMIFAVRV
jgi:class 3 adenylate cyclase